MTSLIDFFANLNVILILLSFKLSFGLLNNPGIPGSHHHSQCHLLPSALSPLSIISSGLIPDCQINFKELLKWMAMHTRRAALGKIFVGIFFCC